MMSRPTTNPRVSVTTARCMETRDRIKNICREMHVEQERPREGLERDYFVEGTFFDVLNTSRSGRGFSVLVDVESPISLGTLYTGRVTFDWDEVGDVR